MQAQPTRRLLWAEEFADHKDGSLMPEVWSCDIGDGSAVGLIGWGNNELEYYTHESITVSDNLTITAKKIQEPTELTCYYGPALWTSGKIHTAGKIGFKYGFLEIRAKLPKGAGSWPALWLLGKNLNDGVAWPACGEIDILENTGAHPFQIQGTIHGPDYSGENGLTGIIQAQSALSEDFNDYAISWNENSIEWFFNGVPYNKISKTDPALAGKEWPFDQEFYLIINLAIGGWFAGEVDPALVQSEFQVDWIKYYSENGVGELFLH
jgi:beta-glucanase (GH16 family)